MIVLRDRKPGIVLLDPQGFATDSEVLERKKKKDTGRSCYAQKRVVVIHGYNRCSLETYKLAGGNVQRSTLCYEKSLKKKRGEGNKVVFGATKLLGASINYFL